MWFKYTAFFLSKFQNYVVPLFTMFSELMILCVPLDSDDRVVNQFITSHVQHSFVITPHSQCPVCLVRITLNQIVGLSHNICL
jgi:hypothetical protein